MPQGSICRKRHRRCDFVVRSLSSDRDERDGEDVTVTFAAADEDHVRIRTSALEVHLEHQLHARGSIRACHLGEGGGGR